MADTSHAHATPPVEGDGVNYRGIVWFMIVLAATTLFCQAIVWGMFSYMAHRERAADTPRSDLAVPQGQNPPAPNLLTDEAGNLRAFRAREDEVLSTYGWADANQQAVRIPIDRAKELILQRGLPARPAAPAAGRPDPARAAIESSVGAAVRTGDTSGGSTNEHTGVANYGPSTPAATPEPERK